MGMRMEACSTFMFTNDPASKDLTNGEFYGTEGLKKRSWPSTRPIGMLRWRTWSSIQELELLKLYTNTDGLLIFHVTASF